MALLGSNCTTWIGVTIAGQSGPTMAGRTPRSPEVGNAGNAPDANLDVRGQWPA